MKVSKCWQNYNFWANYPFKVQTNATHMLVAQTFTNTAICCSDPLLPHAIIPILHKTLQVSEGGGRVLRA